MDILVVFRQVLAVLYDSNQPIPADICLAITHRYDLPATYSHGDTRCRACGGVAPVCSTVTAEGNMKIRFHRCNDCHGTFKSIERQEPITITEVVTKPRSPVQAKSKRGKR